LRQVENGKTQASASDWRNHGLHPYLYFGGNCREAFTRYQEIFGGELFVMSMKDVPDQPIPAGKEDYVLHAALTIGDELLMASDDPTADSFGPVAGMQVNYAVADVDC